MEYIIYLDSNNEDYLIDIVDEIYSIIKVNNHSLNENIIILNTDDYIDKLYNIQEIIEIHKFKSDNKINNTANKTSSKIIKENKVSNKDNNKKDNQNILKLIESKNLNDINNKQLEDLINNFCKKDYWDWLNGKYINANNLKDPKETYNICNIISWHFKNTLKENNIKILTVNVDAYKLYPDCKLMPGSNHFVNLVKLNDNYKIIDFSASQYGYNESPKIMDFNSEVINKENKHCIG